MPRLYNSLSVLLCLYALLLVPFFASAKDSKEPPPVKVDVTSKFTDSPFSLVVNGQRNKLTVTLNNEEDNNFTVNFLAGSFVNPANFSQIIRNLTAIKYGTNVGPKETADIPFVFYSEFAPQELGLVVVVDFSDPTGIHYTGIAHNSTVTIVDPENSIFDLQLIFLYLVLAVVVAGVGYFIYDAFLGGQTKSKKKSKRTTAAATGANADNPIQSPSGEAIRLDEDWIPALHKTQGAKQSPKLRKRKEKSPAGSGRST